MLDELLATDRAHAAAAASLSPPQAILRQLAPDAIVPTPPGIFLKGREAIERALVADTIISAGVLRWSPVRGGISADGRHGFTFGYMDLTRSDGRAVHLKYLSYWIKANGAWSVVAWKRRLRPPGDVRDTMLAPMLPAALQHEETSASLREKHRQSLGEAEYAFSDLAGRIGLGPAFERNADASAMNMGGPAHAEFVLGPAAIGRATGEGSTGPSPVTWGPTVDVLVASSGDLGVVIGFIKRRTTTPAEQAGLADPRGIPFFTIWRRESRRHPWRFVAE